MRPHWVLLVAGLLGTAACVALAAAGFGGLGLLLDHPARAAAIVCFFVAAVATAFSGMSLSTGRREDTSNRWVIPVFGLGQVLIIWLPPWTERHGLWLIDGDATRWIGLALLVIGIVLRVAPMFVLGHRFSAFVAVQEGHRLVTDGIYGVIRHPSYLGGIVALAGWALLFRSALGVLLVLVSLPILLARIDAEERLLADEFGATYADYRAHTWRLVPGIY